MSVEKEQLLKDIEKALGYAAEELKLISKMSPNERIIQESQLQCALYSYFRNTKKFKVHAEAGYIPAEECNKDNRQKSCDLVLMPQKGKKTWVEIKIATHSKDRNNRTILHNKPKKIPNQWNTDVTKLREKAPDQADKMFILLGLFDKDPEQSKNKLLNYVDDFHSTNKVFCHKSFSMTWRNINKIYGKFWVWRWEK